MTAVPVGYCIGNDQYFKRDDVGIIYQINIAEGNRRALVGASLLKAQFDRSAYGCRLYCCWCAQDIEANRFWESMGFVPLAFRTGSAKRGSKGGARVHIFWQRISDSGTGDVTTPFWFPAVRRTGGSIREDRLVLPIPPGTHWSDAKPIILPGKEGVRDSGLGVPAARVPTELEEKKRRALPALSGVERLGAKRTQSLALSPQHSPLPRALGGWSFNPPAPPAPLKRKGKSSGETPKPRKKNDPKLIAAARELRDRWLEKVNQDGIALESQGKYDVSRTLSLTPSEVVGSEVEGSRAIGDQRVEKGKRAAQLPGSRCVRRVSPFWIAAFTGSADILSRFQSKVRDCKIQNHAVGAGVAKS